MQRFPVQKKWKNTPKENKVDITQHDPDQLKKVFSESNCKSLKEILELYLTADVLQLACWIEELRSVCYNTNDLNVHSFTLHRTYQEALA